MTNKMFAIGAAQKSLLIKLLTYAVTDLAYLTVMTCELVTACD